MADAFLYVVHRPTDGARKVGYSGNPVLRLADINRQQKCHCTLEYSEACTAENAIAAAERHAHAMLWHAHVRGEWFAVDLDTARQAIAAAMEAAARGGPFRRPPVKRAKTETFTISATERWVADLDDWRRLEPDLPTRTAAITRICEAAFEKRAVEIDEFRMTRKLPDA